MSEAIKLELITREEDSSVDQSEFEVITCARHQRRENSRLVLVWFGLSLAEKVARVLSTNHGPKYCRPKANAISAQLETAPFIAILVLSLKCIILITVSLLGHHE